jgi:CRISPR/Cas system-associated exonuclease Cas4 (RecB family)
MNSFLKETARNIYKNHSDLKELVIVLPNRRAGLFFSQYLNVLIEKPTWMPEIKTIEDVFYDFAGQKPEENLVLIFELYKVYQAVNPHAETFEKFYYWGEMILKDFNDVDQFLVNPTKLYHHLSEIKTLTSDFSFLSEEQIALIQQFWKSFVHQDKAHQTNFLNFWEILDTLYEKYNQHLKINGIAYSGMLYRKVVENLNSIQQTDKHFIFIGFNAFTQTEEILIKHFVAHFKAEIFWDVDEYYLDQNQEAGLFFRQYQRDKVFQPTFPKAFPNQIKNSNKVIHTYAVPLKVNQANLVGSILNNISTNEPLQETAVILPDEQLLFPLIHALPDHAQEINVTMGYPVKNTPIYAFLEAVLELQRYIKVEDDKIKFYHKPVRDILSSPYLKGNFGTFVQNVIALMEKNNQIYLDSDVLVQGGVIFAHIFKRLQVDQVFDYLTELMRLLADIIAEDSIQRNYLFQCFKQLNQLKVIFAQNDQIPIDLEFILRLFRQIFREVKLPFEGEPLKGLQIMGVLESRNLDFKRVIICNMNEESFPPSRGMNSIIPFNLRKAFGLPVQEQNDAIYAYTFYRLLHAADEVHLIYTTSGDQGKANEKSRYIQQLEIESGLTIKENVIYVPLHLQANPPIVIEKTPEVLKGLNKFVLKGEDSSLSALSPSAINAYLDCKLRFYLQYLAELKEKDAVKEEVDALVFGNLAHDSMELLYGNYIKMKERATLYAEDFALLRSYIYPSIEKAIRIQYHLTEEDPLNLSGQMIIVRDLLQQYLGALLHIDEAYAPFTILHLEEAFKAQISINTSEGEKAIALKGIIDRVDQKEGIIRMIDYKSGQDKKDFGGIDSLFDRDTKDRNKAAMQTLFYGLLYQYENPLNTLALKPAIYNLKEIFTEDFDPFLKDKSKDIQEVENYLLVEENFQQGLKKILEEIFDPSMPFDQTEKPEKCKFCSFKEICGR